MNSIRNKFDHLISITKGNVETKLFPSLQFNIDQYNFLGRIEILMEVVS